MIAVSLPWPPSALRPNGNKGAWRGKYNATKAYKADCAIACRAAGLRKIDGDVRPHLTMVFHQPDRRRADLDNHLAATKAGIDAIADVIGIDDHLFGFTILRGEPVKGGRVDVTITEATEVPDNWQSFGSVAARVVADAAESVEKAA